MQHRTTCSPFILATTSSPPSSSHFVGTPQYNIRSVVRVVGVKVGEILGDPVGIKDGEEVIGAGDGLIDGAYDGGAVGDSMVLVGDELGCLVTSKTSSR